MGRVVIMASGNISDDEFHKKLVRPDDYIICVDGGCRHAARMGLRPHLLMGDLDSLDSDLRAWLTQCQTRVLTHPAEKDFTDAHLGVEEALGTRPDEILLLGCIGDRFDHTLANVHLLLHCRRSGIPARLVDDLNEVILISEETITLRGRPGDRISLLPLSEHASGITTRGTKYILENGTLTLGESRGVSNEFAAPEATISVRRGYLLVIQSRGT